MNPQICQDMFTVSILIHAKSCHLGDRRRGQAERVFC